MCQARFFRKIKEHARQNKKTYLNNPSRQEVFHLRQKHMKELHELKHRQHEEFHHLHEFQHKHHEEFRRLHRSLRFMRPLALILNLVILYLLFRWGGLQAVVIIFALIIITKEIVQFVFFRRLEKKVFKPIEQLKKGFAEIARGNYNVSIDFPAGNEFGQLIYAFNEMADKLWESEKMNAEYEKNRKTLIANISHDLKTPITSIQGYMEIILEGEVAQQDKIKQYLQTIYNNTTYMNKLIDDLFLFSKLDLDKIHFNYELLKIRPFMSDLMTEFKFELEEKQLGFSYEDNMEQDYTVHIDGKRVYQAIRNIIGNAVKYGPEKELQVDVALYAKDGFACLDFKDNGPGIPEDKLPHIFNRFYRVDSERSKDFLSTGLGLAIAKELIEAQGGNLSAASTYGEGTCFTIRLPIA